jgi:hypothetical protein
MRWSGRLAALKLAAVPSAAPTSAAAWGEALPTRQSTRRWSGLRCSAAAPSCLPHKRPGPGGGPPLKPDPTAAPAAHASVAFAAKLPRLPWPEAASMPVPPIRRRLMSSPGASLAALPTVAPSEMLKSTVTPPPRQLFFDCPTVVPSSAPPPLPAPPLGVADLAPLGRSAPPPLMG